MIISLESELLYAESIEQISKIAVIVINPFSGVEIFCEAIFEISFIMELKLIFDNTFASALSAPISGRK